MLLVLLALGGGGARSAVAGPDDSWKGPEGFARAQAWFQGLGFPDLRYAPFVRVDYDGRPADAISLMTESPFYGFLLEEDDRSVRVFSLALRVDRWPRQRIHLERLSLDAAMGEGLALLRSWRDAEAKTRGGVSADPERLSPLGVHVSGGADTFVLACACAWRGSMGRAGELWQEMTRGTRPLGRETWAQIVGGRMARNLCLDFADGERTWTQHLAAHRRWLGMFPRLGSSAIRARIPVLERMAAAESSSGASPRALTGEAAPADRASDLVERLVDPGAWRMPGESPRVTFMRDGADPLAVERSPAEELVRLGDAAIPRLIEALTDDRIVRNVVLVPIDSYPDFSVHSMRIGDVALDVLVAITGIDFSIPPEGGNGRSMKWTLRGTTLGGTEEGRVVQRRAEEWWDARKDAATAPAGTPREK